MTEDLEAISRALSRLRREPRGAAAGATARERAALHAVDAGGDVTVGEVARRLEIDPSRASRLVRSAIRRGLLAPVAGRDARAVVLRLTPEGRALARGAAATRLRRIAVALSGFSPAERRTFAALLQRFAEAMEKAAVEGPAPG